MTFLLCLAAVVFAFGVLFLRGARDDNNDGSDP